MILKSNVKLAAFSTPSQDQRGRMRFQVAVLTCIVVIPGKTLHLLYITRGILYEIKFIESVFAKNSTGASRQKKPHLSHIRDIDAPKYVKSGASQQCENGHILDTISVKVSKNVSKPLMCPKGVQNYKLCPKFWTL